MKIGDIIMEADRKNREKTKRDKKNSSILKLASRFLA
jgi:hypothetical protein